MPSQAPRIQNRVFCVGMNKTGTSTMKHCFMVFGLGPIASPSMTNAGMGKATRAFRDNGDCEPLLKIAEKYRSFEDRPWNLWDMYRHLDERFPDSQFILTVRDPDSWWKSIHNWLSITKPEAADMHKWHLRVDALDRDAMVASYLQYNQEVQNHFAGTNKLLIMDLEGGDAWEPLCSFLKQPVPRMPFPHANRQYYTDVDSVILRRQRRNRICQECGEALRRHRKPQQKKFTRRGRRRAVNRVINGSLRVLRPIKWTLTSAIRRPKQNLERLRHEHPGLTIDNVAAVTCFFNPCSSRRRLENYLRFRKGLDESGIRLLTVELAFNEHPFALPAGPDLIQLRSPHVMWHKERLLNIGIERLLNEGYEKIVWLDADVRFDDPYWAWHVAARLEHVRLCQVFSYILIENGPRKLPQSAVSCLRYLTDRGKLLKQPGLRPKPAHPFGYASGRSGYGWAARAEVLRQVPLYDRAIIGGGDKLMYAACFVNDPVWRKAVMGLTQSPRPCRECGHHNRSEAYTRHYLEWARAWASAVDSSVGYVQQPIRDLYHGKHAARKYNDRRHILIGHQYDPETDVTVDDNGCLQWAGTSPELRQGVTKYFIDRREDD